jgi:hypothetical protein
MALGRIVSGATGSPAPVDLDHLGVNVAESVKQALADALVDQITVARQRALEIVLANLEACRRFADRVSEVGELAGRFSPNRGRFGLLMSRSFKDKALFAARGRDTADDGHGFIRPLDDEDLRLLVEARRNDGDPHATLILLKDRLNALVM